jgi:uncharacterized phage infection (PIP) family protein YhgE
LPEDPNTDQWIPKWTNLKHIHDALSIFLVEECGQRLPLPGGRPDLKAVAQSASLNDTIGLLKLLVVAAINCADRIEYLQQMQQLTESTQEVLMQTVQEVGEEAEEEEDEEEEEPDEAPSGVREVHSPMAEPLSSPRRSVEIESVLESEERLGKVIADNQRIAHEKRELRKQLDEAQARHQKLQERLEQSQDELKESNDRLAAILAGKSDVPGRTDAKQEMLIATLESRLIETETEVEDLRKNSEVLKIKSEKAQKLQDDYDEIKIERDRLARKANTAEKYRQKLEASQDLEKDNNNLKSKVAELQSQLRQSDMSRTGTNDLQREIDEYRRLLPSIEQERYELNEMKKRLEFDFHTLEARYHETNEQLSRQNRNVEELQSRLSDYEEGIEPPLREEKPVEPVNKDFEKEEAEFAESEARLTAALLNGDSAPSTPLVTSPTTPTSAATLPAGLVEDDTISEDELKAIMSAMRAQAQAGTSSERASSLRAQKKMIIAIERQRTKNQTLLEHVQKQDGTIKDLQQRVASSQAAQKAAEEIPPPPPPKDVPALSPEDEESEIERLTNQNIILTRELRLMASAWHDQSLRLASSSSGRMRVGINASDAKGFLSRQRRKVEAAAATPKPP